MPESPAGRSRDEIVGIVRHGYDLIADDYLAAVRDPRDGDPRDTWLELLTERLAVGSRVLDAGCGPGVPTAAHLVRLGYDVLGVDVSDRQIALARENVVGARFEVGDFAAYTGVAPGSLDAIVALYSLTHVPRTDYVELFSRFATWLRPGGWFLASLGRSDSAGWDEEDFLGFEGAASFTNSYGVDHTLALLRAAGFEIDRHSLVRDDTTFGPEQWLWVLAHGPL